MKDYDEYDATGLAELVATGQVTPRELVEAAISRIEERNPKINALSWTQFDAALAAAERPVSGPFAGVPFLAKDAGAAMRGEPHQFGCRVLREAGYVAENDSYLGIRFREAGFISLGRTTTPEFATSAVTESSATGITRNPWDLDRITGGSSGGAGAVVAARIIPAAHGNDGAGSIRIPAAATGCVGLKSTRARVSNGPDAGEIWQGFAHQGSLTRSVRDTAAILDAISGPFPGDPYVCPPPARPFVQEVGAPTGRLRIGVMTSLPGFDTHADCVTAVEDTVRMLEALGHEVVEAEPDAYGRWIDMLPVFTDLIASYVAADLKFIEMLAGRTVDITEFDSANQHYAGIGQHVTTADFIEAIDVLQRWGRDVASWWHEGNPEILLTPTIAGPAARIGELDIDLNDPEASLHRHYSFFPYTPAFNVSGQPAISLPMHRNAEGLPIGVQFVSAYGRDDVLIRLASQLEAAYPWDAHRPAWIAEPSA
ncbi:amidase [Streptomyces sp. NBC_01618]|uniref:amidase n=1 Tax=Streptomyces sp. NBC_01618 TaxID=2975900 RepID=UPI00386CD6A2|nr:amidase [Streptomyces sp. NBC_01618]